MKESKNNFLFSKVNINYDLYLLNPQIAKTEELLQFLPMVIEKLKADPDQICNLKTNSESNFKNLKTKRGIKKNRNQKIKVQKLNNKVKEDSAGKCEEKLPHLPAYLI